MQEQEALKIVRSGILDATGCPISTERILNIDPSKFPPGTCQTKLPNGEVHQFRAFCLHGVQGDHGLTIAYCDLVDLALGIEALTKIYFGAMENLTEEQQFEILKRLDDRREERDLSTTTPSS